MAAKVLSHAAITKFKNAVLGRRFDLSISVVPAAKMKVLNRQYRKINKPTDILSFPLSKNSGEIVLCLPEVKSHAKTFNTTAEKYLPYLVIHGMVHLKGHDHGRIMDKLEVKYCRALKVQHPLVPLPPTNGRTNRSRH